MIAHSSPSDPVDLARSNVVRHDFRLALIAQLLVATQVTVHWLVRTVITCGVFRWHRRRQGTRGGGRQARQQTVAPEQHIHPAPAANLLP
jgi:hypothetical protein